MGKVLQKVMMKSPWISHTDFFNYWWSESNINLRFAICERLIQMQTSGKRKWQNWNKINPTVIRVHTTRKCQTLAVLSSVGHLGLRPIQCFYFLESSKFCWALGLKTNTMLLFGHIRKKIQNKEYKSYVFWNIVTEFVKKIEINLNSIFRILSYPCVFVL